MSKMPQLSPLNWVLIFILTWMMFFTTWMLLWYHYRPVYGGINMASRSTKLYKWLW